MKQLVPAVVICVAFVGCWGNTNASEALRPPPPPPRPPGFDYFLLALTWPNQYCLTSKIPCNPAVPPQRFTIHGLWPQDKSPFGNPHDCQTSEQLTDEILEELKDNYQLLEYWPDVKNAQDFDKSKKIWRHEWKKHGTCSVQEFKPLEYFKKSIDLAKKYSGKILESLKKRGVRPGVGNYQISEILEAVKDATGGISPLLSLNDDKGLAEIRLCVRKDAVTLFDCKIKFTGPPSPSPSPSPSQSPSSSLATPSPSTSWVSSILEALRKAAELL